MISLMNRSIQNFFSINRTTLGTSVNDEMILNKPKETRFSLLQGASMNKLLKARPNSFLNFSQIFSNDTKPTKDSLEIFEKSSHWLKVFIHFDSERNQNQRNGLIPARK